MLEPIMNLRSAFGQCLGEWVSPSHTYCTKTTIDHTPRVPLRPKLLNKI